MLRVICLISVICLFTSCIGLKKFMNKYPDSNVEQYVEGVIESATGLDIDLTEEDK